jgi:hypothetical protein
MKKSLPLLALALVCAAAIAAAPATAEEVRHFPQQATLGFYRGQTVEYLDFGPIKLRAGNALAPIWAVTNGVDGQYNVIDVVPGQKGYTPLWSVMMVTWNDGAEPQLLRSAAAVRRAVANGQATVKRAGIVVNCPLI